MVTNLIEAAKSYLTPEVIEKASALVGESPATTRRALETATPGLVAGLADRASSASGAQTLMGILGEAGLTGAAEPLSERLRGMSGEELVQLGKDLLGRVFGARLGPMVDATAASSGVKAPAMSSLLGLAAPIVMGVLGHQVQARHLDAPGLASLLAEQKGLALGALPASVSAALGGPPARDVARRASSPGKAPAGLGRLWPLLAIPLVILGALLLRRREAPAPAWAPDRGLGAGITPETPAVETPTPPVTEPAPIPPQHVEVLSELTGFLEGSGGEPTRRFVFDDLNFEFATTNLTPSSLATLESLAHVLEAHPGAHIVVEGHTDSLGVPEANARLSLDRAEALKDALLARGIAAERVTTRGLGEEQPLAPNDTAEGRARNRRTEIVVTR